MMGAHHAACGAAVWVALTNSETVRVDLPLVGEHVIPLGFGVIQADPLAVVMGAFICAGAALLPDADHPNATIAHSLPPVSNGIVGGIGTIAGGHRHGTHSIIGLVAFTALAWLASFLTPVWFQKLTEWVTSSAQSGALQPWPAAYTEYWFSSLQIGPAILSMVLVGFALTTLKFVPHGAKRAAWLVAAAVAALVLFFAPAQQEWFPIAVAVGVAVHIVGDMLTVGGVNLVWPLTFRPPKALSLVPVVNWMWKPNGYLAFPVLGVAGSWREWLLLVPVSLYAIWGLLAAMSAGVLALVSGWS